jgi:DNA-binding response OmpR family regulator
MKLLIVDDDTWLCSALARGLVKLGHFARVATSMDSAFALAQSEEPAAVLTDLDLGPGGDGVELIQRLRAAGSNVPVLMMSGSDPKVARARLRGAGLDEVVLLEKPFPFEDLMQRLAELVPEPQAIAAAHSQSNESNEEQPVVARPAPQKGMAVLMGNVVRSLGGRVL